MLHLEINKPESYFAGLILLLLCGCTQQQYYPSKSSFIRGGYAEEVMMQIDGSQIDGCDIETSDVQTSLISRSPDATLTDDRLVSGKIIEKWVMRGCNNKINAYIISMQGSPNGMDEISVDRQNNL